MFTGNIQDLEGSFHCGVTIKEENDSHTGKARNAHQTPLLYLTYGTECLSFRGRAMSNIYPLKTLAKTHLS
jgi:hypothetical protein